MKKLLIITQKVDANDDLLGFFVDWIAEFAKHFDRVEVITLGKGEYQLSGNIAVHSLGKERQTSKFYRVIKFYQLLFKLISGTDAIFAHMSPIFVIAVWPVALLYGVKIIFWYLHRSVTWRLKIAEKLAYRIVTAAKESLQLKSKKVIEVGHGINVVNFTTQRDWTSAVISIISVGRISRIKNYEILIGAAKILKEHGLSFAINIVGQPVRSEDQAYLEELQQGVARFSLQDQVRFVGFVPYARVAPYYQNANIAVNLTPTGGIDKAVLEGMAAGCLSLVSNRAFEKYFQAHSRELIFDYKNPVDLAEKITNLVRLPAEQKKKISEFLTEQAKTQNTQKVIGNILKVLS